MTLTPRISKLVATISLLAICSTAPAQELETLKENTDRWIEVRGRLAKEQSNWEIEKQILKNGIDTLTSSKEALEEDVVFHKNASEEITSKTTEAQERLESFEKTDELLLSQIIKYETRILALEKRLPDPLKEQLDQLIAKVPTPNAVSETPLPNRLQNVVAIMTIIDEFNNDLTLTHAIKELDGGEVIEVRILYWGLATGYATNNAGTRSWILNPGDDEWQWNEANEAALAIKQLFDVYDKVIDPALVAVPFSIDGKEGAK